MQPDSDWELQTTLERTTEKKHSVESYWERADSVVNEIESATRADWKIPTYAEMRSQLAAAQDSMRVHIPSYQYLVYLRHHGFPSPLLDWTRSPYIAAYFAFEPRCAVDRCAVFAFIETPEGGKSKREGDVTISGMGPFITTHPRHFAQKADYTIATQWNSDNRKHYFAPHATVAPCSVGVQDVFIKITIPRADRKLALRELDDYNINHYTLFQTEDALIRSAGLRAFDIGES